MVSNAVIEVMLKRASTRKYKDDIPTDDIIRTVVRAGMQAPFAAQLYSVLLSRKKENTPWHAPLQFIVCVDAHKMETIMARRNWKMVSNNLAVLTFGMQDATLMAENMVIAAESLGLGSCFIGLSPAWAGKIVDECHLPKRVLPLVMLVMGYPAEIPPPRPRYPLEFVLFEDCYPEFSEEMVSRAMSQMDEGYLAQDYYLKGKFIIKLDEGRSEKFTLADYSWTEHISRKWGQWHKSPDEWLALMEKCGFELPK